MSRPTQTEFRTLGTPEAKEIEALEVFSWDLRAVRSHVTSLLLDQRQADEATREIVWDAVLVRYWRAFKMDPRNMLLACIESLPVTERSLHDHFVRLRHQLFAHHVGIGATCRVTVVSEVDCDENARVTAVACHQFRVSQLGSDQAEQLVALLDALEPRVSLAIETLKTRLFSEWRGASRQRVKTLKVFTRADAENSIVRDVIPRLKH